MDDRLQSELSNQREIFMYLNGELAKKTDEILELHERVQALSDESERQTLEHENKLLAQKDAFQLQHARLQEDNLKLKTDLDKARARSWDLQCLFLRCAYSCGSAHDPLSKQPPPPLGPSPLAFIRRARLLPRSNPTPHPYHTHTTAACPLFPESIGALSSLVMQDGWANPPRLCCCFVAIASYATV